jgi:hypothetical protein
MFASGSKVDFVNDDLRPANLNGIVKYSDSCRIGLGVFSAGDTLSLKNPAFFSAVGKSKDKNICRYH